MARVYEIPSYQISLYFARKWREVRYNKARDRGEPLPRRPGGRDGGPDIAGAQRKSCHPVPISGPEKERRR